MWRRGRSPFGLSPGASWNKAGWPLGRWRRWRGDSSIVGRLLRRRRLVILSGDVVDFVVVDLAPSRNSDLGRILHGESGHDLDGHGSAVVSAEQVTLLVLGQDVDDGGVVGVDDVVVDDDLVFLHHQRRVVSKLVLDHLLKLSRKLNNTVPSIPI